ncbi:MAG TPA: glycosyltransferase family 9 protein [Bryobacteraceae bacterium]
MNRLLIRPGAIGDCILCFPALRHLAAGGAEIWAPSAVLPLIQFARRTRSIASTGIDLVGIGDYDLPDLGGFHEIVSWYGSNRPEFRAALESTGIPCTFHPALPDPAGSIHAVDFFAQQVGAPSGAIPRIDPGPVERRVSIVIHPFSGSKNKNWPLASFEEVARRLPLPVEWTAGPEETLPRATRFENLFDLARWLAGAQLYIGNDSGITHLGAAIGVPVIALFTTTSPEVWAPRGGNVTVLRDASVDAVIAAVSSARQAGALP